VNDNTLIQGQKQKQTQKQGQEQGTTVVVNVNDSLVSTISTGGELEGAGDGELVTLCHKGETIQVAPAAVSAHLVLHGDTLGPCEDIVELTDAVDEKKLSKKDKK
jgi:hypothetical protein